MAYYIACGHEIEQPFQYVKKIIYRSPNPVTVKNISTIIGIKIALAVYAKHELFVLRKKIFKQKVLVEFNQK